MNLTELEKKVLELIRIATDDFGEEEGYVYSYLKENDVDMKIARGVIGSLVKKGILEKQDEYLYYMG